MKNSDTTASKIEKFNKATLAQIKRMKANGTSQELITKFMEQRTKAAADIALNNKS